MTNQIIPIVLFAHARPCHLIKTLQGLKCNEVPIIYAFSDGPKDASKENAVFEVRKLLHNIEWCEKVIVEREYNWGLGTSIRAGVTEVFQKYDKLIVVEDDIVLRPGAYKYAVKALCHYENVPEIMTISLWNHPILVPKGTDTGFFSERFMCWGWGTYKKYWQLYNSSIQDIYSSIDKELIQKIKEYGEDLIQQVEYSKKSDIWYVGYALLQFKLDKISFFPSETLVVNIGKDSTAVNDGPDHTSFLENFELMNKPIKFPIGMFPSPKIQDGTRKKFNKYFYLKHPFYIRVFKLLKKNLYFLYEPIKYWNA